MMYNWERFWQEIFIFRATEFIILLAAFVRTIYAITELFSIISKLSVNWVNCLQSNEEKPHYRNTYTCIKTGIHKYTRTLNARTHTYHTRTQAHSRPGNSRKIILLFRNPIPIPNLIMWKWPPYDLNLRLLGWRFDCVWLIYHTWLCWFIFVTNCICILQLFSKCSLSLQKRMVRSFGDANLCLSWKDKDEIIFSSILYLQHNYT